MNISDELERQMRKEQVLGSAKKRVPPYGRGFDYRDVHKAAEELRMEHKGSHDPAYHDSKKNK